MARKRSPSPFVRRHCWWATWTAWIGTTLSSSCSSKTVGRKLMEWEWICLNRKNGISLYCSTNVDYSIDWTSGNGLIHLIVLLFSYAEPSWQKKPAKNDMMSKTRSRCFQAILNTMIITKCHQFSLAIEVKLRKSFQSVQPPPAPLSLELGNVSCQWRGTSHNLHVDVWMWKYIL